MADAPWRCSECGTINEPVANACRTCGRWPSLFDLEESKVDDALEIEPEPDLEPAVEDFEPETPEEMTAEPAEPESPSVRRRRIIGKIIVPLAVVIYLVITSIVNR